MDGSSGPPVTCPSPITRHHKSLTQSEPPYEDAPLSPGGLHATPGFGVSEKLHRNSCNYAYARG
eukprot:6092925-Pyramimonas_sp.AAC.2